jgi:dipeptidyl aminopeptidase/acylaminoacyl peptidase
MTDQSRLQLTDALLEKMLAQRAGPGAPADFVPAIAAAIESTGQRAPGLLGTLSGSAPSRTRRGSWPFAPRRILQVAALAAVAVAVAAGAGLFLRQSPAVIGGPSGSPSTTPVPSQSVEPSSSTAPAPPPVATPRPAAVIAYTKYVFRTNSMAETGRVWIVGADETGAHELFPDGIGVQSGVAWSPDGTRLVYTEAGRLYLTDASGTAPQVADTGCASACSDGSAAFSTDGTRLVFVRGASKVIATIDLASGRVVELGSTGATANERPRWSPDGKQIVFSRQDKFNNGSAVFVVDSDGQNLRQLSKASLPARLPEWSPDGSRILFTSLGIKYVRVAGTNTQQITQDVYTVGPDWTDLRRLTKDGNSIGATWTPDGRILFSTGCRGDCAATGGLWTMDADAGNPELFVPGGSGVDAPLWGIDAAWQPTP